MRRRNCYCRSMCRRDDGERRSGRGCDMLVVRAMHVTGNKTPISANTPNECAMSHTSQVIFLQRNVHVAARPAARYGATSYTNIANGS